MSIEQRDESHGLQKEEGKLVFYWGYITCHELYDAFSFNLHNFPVIIPVFNLREVRLREVKYLPRTTQMVNGRVQMQKQDCLNVSFQILACL